MATLARSAYSSAQVEMIRVIELWGSVRLVTEDVGDYTERFLNAEVRALLLSRRVF